MLRRVRCVQVTTTIHYATATRMELLHFILAAYGMTFIIIHGSIFNKIRPKCNAWGGLGRLFHCHLCMGFWVGVFLWGISPYTELFNFDYTCVNAFICACISAGTSYLLGVMVNDFGIKVVHKGGES